MRLENEELHYRAKFDVYPYATQNPAFEKLCQILWDWVRDKERRSRSNLFEALTTAGGKDAFVLGDFASPARYDGGMPKNRSHDERRQAALGYGVRRTGSEALV